MITHRHQFQRGQTGKTIFIINPAAGSADLMSQVHELTASLPQSISRQAADPKEARAIARHSLERGFDRIVAVGGDGTINAVLNGIAPDFADVELGIIPLGTGNDLARSLGISSDLQQAFEALRTRTVRPIDVARVLGKRPRYFLNASAGGFSDAVSSRLDRETKSRWGPLAYIISAAAALPDLTEHRLLLRLDGKSLQINAYNVVVANGRTIAGGIPIAPNALIDDGELDVVIVPALSLAEVALTAPTIYFGKHAESDRIVLTRAKTIEIESNPPMAFNIDGEPIGTRSMRYDILPGAVRMNVGAHAEGLRQLEDAKSNSF